MNAQDIESISASDSSDPVEVCGDRHDGIDQALSVDGTGACDARFSQGLFKEAVQTLLCGDTDADTDPGRAAMRDYIKATVGFEKLSVALGRPQKSLMRMFGFGGNPTAGMRRTAGKPACAVLHLATKFDLLICPSSPLPKNTLLSI